MRRYEARPIAEVLATFETTRGRKCQRRNLVSRLRRGRVEDLGQVDLHMIRQAKHRQRIGRTLDDALHTRLGPAYAVRATD